MKTGIVNLPLHGGKAPYWLFEKMERLSREIMLAIVSEMGPMEFIRKISDPLWFQAFGCVLGFDWHSSGVTTTVCGAIKEAARNLSEDLGFYVAGGKGAASRKTPFEIESCAEKEGRDFSSLVYASKITAKVDSSVLQDGYQLYHHTFFYTKSGDNWAVIQQGMNEDTKYARRYHWISEDISDFVCEPHKAICCDKSSEVINLAAQESTDSRNIIADISKEKPEKILRDYDGAIENLKNRSNKYSREFFFPKRHDIYLTDIEKKRLSKILCSTYERKPDNFETLVSMPGVGPKTVRSLALISELVYSVPFSIKDPARFGFAHGGKDKIPYPVDSQTYNKSIDILHNALKESRIGRSDKINAFRRLASFYG